MIPYIFLICWLTCDIDRQKHDKVENRYKEEEGCCIPIEYDVQGCICSSNCLKFFVINLFKYLYPLHDSIRHFFLGQNWAIFLIFLLRLCNNLSNNMWCCRSHCFFVVQDIIGFKSSFTSLWFISALVANTDSILDYR